MFKKLISISTTSDDKVTFHFDDLSTISCRISGYEDRLFLYNLNGGSNSEVFHQLGISDPHSLYKEMGIYVGDGECPECKREDLDKVFNYLLKNYSVDSDKKEENLRQPSEWDWLLN